ncbi:MAG: mannose-6-phosphate isomerase [Chlamydiales bacterium]|jgi:mannose-6-phosphate isomerase
MSLREPLRFEPLAFNKVWGGDRLRRFLSEPDAAEGPIGEVWQLSDRDGASSIVVGGGFEGRSLRGLMMSEKDAILGSAHANASGYFPLLVKLLDSGDSLSVQVHPDRKAARAIGCGALAKSEAWYVLSTEPGSQIHLGLKPDVDATTFAEHAASPDVVDLLEVYPVRAGQFINVPAGTVHAIGPGITLAEIQQNSDTTYRMFDWGRVGLNGKPRDIQLEDALRSIDYGQELAGPVDALSAQGRLLESDAFSIDLVLKDTDDLAEGSAAVLVVLEGRGQLDWEDAPASRSVEAGQTWLLPADLGRRSIRGASKIFRALLVQPGREDSDE